MFRIHITRRLAVSATGALIASLLTAGAIAAAPAGHAATTAPCGVLFDDFHYSSAQDPALSQRGWTARDHLGGPGVPGAGWSSNNLTFPTQDGQRVLRMTTSSDGTVAGTSQAELYHQQKFFEGTYAARVRFDPVGPSDTDHVVQTFFTITPLDFPRDPRYSELDFEYLPNGGWGEQGPIMYQVSWNTYEEDPWWADNVHTAQRRSFAGWQDLLIQVTGGTVRYFINGEQVAEHGGRFYPVQEMAVHFNQWIIDLEGHSGQGTSTYVQDVDWVYFSENEAVSQATVNSRVAGYRADAVTHVDTVGSVGDCPDPTPPTPTPTGTPTPTPTPTDPPADCDTAPAWSWATVYLEGQLVRHERSLHGDPSGPPSGDGVRLWEAQWWTQGSEPGWTPQWRDLGPCNS